MHPNAPTRRSPRYGPRRRSFAALALARGVAVVSLHDARIHQVEQRVVDGPQIGIDLLAHVARQEAEPLARFDGGARHNDAIDFLALEQRNRVRDREPGLSGAGRADTKDQLMTLECAD